MRSAAPSTFRSTSAMRTSRTLAAPPNEPCGRAGVGVQRQETLVRAAQAYFDLLVAQAVVGVAEQALEISHDYEVAAASRRRAGIALKGDELR